jgi:ATP-dependent helicase/nuclease subunit A
VVGIFNYNQAIKFTKAQSVDTFSKRFKTTYLWKDKTNLIHPPSNIIYLMERSEISDLFSKQSKAEVAIAGLLKREGKPSRPVSGKIDRLAVLEKDVLIADFKTSSNPPGPLKPIPDQTVVQLATYRALVGDLYPRHKIRCFVIYTATLQIIEVPDEVLDAGLSLIE